MLDSVGLDSLDIVELQLYYEDVTGYETKDPTLPVLTVKDLIDLMP
jgi:acyl carrier protein